MPLKLEHVEHLLQAVEECYSHLHDSLRYAHGVHEKYTRREPPRPSALALRGSDRVCGEIHPRGPVLFDDAPYTDYEEVEDAS